MKGVLNNLWLVHSVVWRHATLDEANRYRMDGKETNDATEPKLSAMGPGDTRELS